ncbi:MAG TPA: MarR family winged helix-turn-helix transcriptional regulator [Pseudonocardiaceae bacterium]|nr:MarR family winged helix-turn-helix transcriptional regulator [Pseudonocardiaceae bacterium]
MNNARWLDEDEQRIWRSYLQMQRQLAARLNRQLQADCGLSLADYEVLVQLTDTQDGRLRSFELARGLLWEQSRLSHHLNRMHNRGLVVRQECCEDGRGTFVVLTTAGRRAIEAAAPGHVAMVRRLFFDGLTRDQILMLEQLSTQVLARLDTDHGRAVRASVSSRGSPLSYHRSAL